MTCCSPCAHPCPCIQLPPARGDVGVRQAACCSYTVWHATLAPCCHVCARDSVADRFRLLVQASPGPPSPAAPAAAAQPPRLRCRRRPLPRRRRQTLEPGSSAHSTSSPSQCHPSHSRCRLKVKPCIPKPLLEPHMSVRAITQIQPDLLMVPLNHATCTSSNLTQKCLLQPPATGLLGVGWPAAGVEGHQLVWL